MSNGSDTNSTIATINLVFKLAELGAKYMESRQQRQIDVTRADTIDTVEEALREFEGLQIPDAYEPPPSPYDAATSENETDGATSDDDPEGNPV